MKKKLLTVEGLLHSIVNDSNPCSLDKVDIITKEVRYVPVLTILLSILKSDFEPIVFIPFKHLMAVTCHKTLHLVLLPRQEKICICIFNIIGFVSRTITHLVTILGFFKKLHSPESNKCNKEQYECHRVYLQPQFELLLEWSSRVLPRNDAWIHRMRKFVHSLVLEPHGFFHAAISDQESLNKEHIIDVECLVPRLNISESDISIVDVWLLSLEFFTVILVLQLGHLGIDAPHLLFVDGCVDLVVFHLFLQN